MKRFARPVFLLSPASLSGARGRRILSGAGTSGPGRDLAAGRTVPIGDVFASISALYFRGKQAYARHFGRLANGVPESRVITADRGLVPLDQPTTLSELRAMAEIDIDPREAAYTHPLRESVAALSNGLDEDVPVVLLGSLATSKYVEPLASTVGDRLHAPATFIGIGEMQRGSVLLQAVASGVELEYVPIDGPRSGVGRARRRSR